MKMEISCPGFHCCHRISRTPFVLGSLAKYFLWACPPPLQPLYSKQRFHRCSGRKRAYDNISFNTSSHRWDALWPWSGAADGNSCCNPNAQVFVMTDISICVQPSISQASCLHIWPTPRRRRLHTESSYVLENSPFQFPLYNITDWMLQ